MKNNAPQPAQLEHNEAPTLIEIPAQEACNESKAAVTPARPDGDNKVAIVRTHASQKIIELIALGVAACILLVSVYPHVSKSSVEATLRATDVQLKLPNSRSELILPGEHGEVVSLSGATASGAIEVQPPWLQPSDGLLDLDQDAASGRQPDPTHSLRLQGLRIPNNGGASLSLGAIYRPNTRGISLEIVADQPSLVSFGKITPSLGDAIQPIEIIGKELKIEMIPLQPRSKFIILRNVPIAEIDFKTNGESSVIDGSVVIKDASNPKVAVIAGDQFTLKSVRPMIIRELSCTNGVLEVRLSASEADHITLGDNSPRNLLPTWFDWARSRWPTQFYGTLSAVVLLWLAARKWWNDSE